MASSYKFHGALLLSFSLCEKDHPELGKGGKVDIKSSGRVAPGPMSSQAPAHAPKTSLVRDQMIEGEAQSPEISPARAPQYSRRHAPGFSPMHAPKVLTNGDLSRG